MKRSAKRWLAVGFGAFALLAVGSGGALAWYLREHRTRYFTDAATIDRPMSEVAPRDVLWSDPLDLPLNTAADDYAPGVTPDGRTLYFARAAAGRGADVYVADKSPTGWSDPRPFAAINTEADELDPVVAPDGQAVYFVSNRRGGEGEYDLWVTRRDAAGQWRTPENLGPDVNSRDDDYGPGLAPDGVHLYFASNRRGEGERAAGDFDLYRVDLSAPTPAAAAIDELNTDYDETAPAVSPAGDFVYFASDRPGGRGAFDLYRARRVDGGYLPPDNLGDPVNTPGNELDPAPTLEGFGLHFAADDGGLDYNLRYATSREVFVRTERYRAELDWNALWPAIGPYLLWMAATVVALLLLIMVLGRLEYRKLSLLAKCMLVSLIVHMLMMIGFAFWGVTSTISQWKRPAGLQVALTSPSVSTPLAGQIRGEVTEVAVAARLPDAMREPPPDPELVQPEPDAPPVDVETALIKPQPVLRNDGADARPRFETITSTVSAPQQTPRLEIETPHEQVRRDETEAGRPVPVAATAGAPRAETALVAAPPPARAVAIVPPTLDTLGADSNPQRFTDAGTRRGSLPAAPEPAAAADMDDLYLFEVQVPSEHVEGRAAEPAARPAPVRVEAERAEPTRFAHAPAAVALTIAAPSDAASSARRFAEANPARGAAPAVPAFAPPPMHLEMETEPTFEVIVPAAAPRQRAEAPRSEATPQVGEFAVMAAASPAALPRPHDAPQFQPTWIEPGGGTGAMETRSLAAVRAAAAPSRLVAAAPVPAAAPAGPIDLDLPVLEGSAAASEPERRAVVHANRLATQRVDLHSAMRRPVHKPEPAAEIVALPAAPAQHEAFEPARVDVAADRVRIQAPEPMVLASLDLDLSVPSRTKPTPDSYRHRAPEERQRVLKEMGGDAQTERSVALALDWLARHQSSDGRWNGTHFDEHCGRCPGEQRVKCDVALTGLALLCFQAANHTHMGDGPYTRNVQRALDWLLIHQQDNGDLMFNESMYSQGIASIAIAEAYGMTEDPRLRPAVESAVNFIFDSRNRFVGGWRYRPGQVGDTSVMGWQVMAFKAAERAGVDVPDEAFDVARTWLDLVHRANRPGHYAYQPQREVTPAMTAEAMFINQLLGVERDDRRMAGSAAYVLDHMPHWEPDANTYYWYYATLALFQHQGEEWEQWNERIKDVLIENQRTDGKAAGSWDPDGRWAAVAGRVYQTAISTLTLQVYYRYLPRFLQEEE